MTGRLDRLDEFTRRHQWSTAAVTGLSMAIMALMIAPRRPLLAVMTAVFTTPISYLVNQADRPAAVRGRWPARRTVAGFLVVGFVVSGVAVVLLVLG